MHTDTYITLSSQAAGLLHDSLVELDHEELWAIFLAGRNRLITAQMLTKGTLRTTPIDARTIIKHALLCNATAVILVHNHPGGDPHPSRQDIRETDKVRLACDLMDIKLVDHVVLSFNSFYSFSDEKVSNYPDHE
jgi:DNA repair protein RadC